MEVLLDCSVGAGECVTTSVALDGPQCNCS